MRRAEIEARARWIEMHVIEPATSGRAKCRGCSRPIDKGELRFGERTPNPFAEEGLTTLWFHLRCGALKRPEVFLEALRSTEEQVGARELLEAQAHLGQTHRRLPRIDGAERAPTGRARCRSCKEMIEKGGWRIRLVFFQEGRFNPSGFLHAQCCRDYFETSDLLERARHFSPELSDVDVASLQESLEG